MSDKTEQFDKNNSVGFSDDAIRQFLFGRLSPPEQATFEECLFTDDRLEARVRLAEFDLADDYALARMSVADRKAFERTFLLTAGRKRTLTVSNALRDRFASDSKAADRGREKASRLRFLFDSRQRALRFAFSVVAFVVLVAAAWLAIRELRHKREAYQLPIVRSSPTPSSKRETQHPPGPPSPPEHQAIPSPMPPHEPVTSAATESPAVVSIFLIPMPNPPPGFREPQVKLPKNERDVLRLQLSMESDESGTYRAEILTIDGRPVFNAEALKPTHAAGAARVELDIPVGALRTGQYEVRLSRVNGFEAGTTKYYFRAR